MFYGIGFCFLLVLYKDLSRLMQLNFLVLRRRNQRQIYTIGQIRRACCGRFGKRFVYWTTFPLVFLLPASCLFFRFVANLFF